MWPMLGIVLSSLLLTSFLHSLSHVCSFCFSGRSLPIVDDAVIKAHREVALKPK